jgi:hypothetical protein
MGLFLPAFSWFCWLEHCGARALRCLQYDTTLAVDVKEAMKRGGCAGVWAVAARRCVSQARLLWGDRTHGARARL